VLFFSFCLPCHASVTEVSFELFSPDNIPKRIQKGIMDGLEDQAEAAIEGIIDQLSTHEKVEIKHSSWDSVMLRIADALRNQYHQRQTPPHPMALFFFLQESVPTLLSSLHG
jgi:hypothetical protein